MKKTVKILVAIIVALSLLAGCVSSTETQTEPQQAMFTSEVPLDTLMVGVQDMSGDFINGFGNNSYDLSIKTLTGGYMDTYEITPQGEIVLNPTIVENLDIKTDDNGNKTYTFKLQDDLFFNNGDNITAKDYVAYVMWVSSPEWTEAGASTSGSDGLVGYEAYKNGETDVFEGVKLIDEYEFSVTIAAENLPYYWETVYAVTEPIHYETYLPNSELVSDDQGTRIDFSEGDLLTNCKRIAETERFAPTVTAGPYKFISFENQTVTLELNEYFKGDSAGNKPTLKYIIQKEIPAETDVEWVINGQVDLVEGVVEHEKIESVKASDSANFNTYLRSGYGFLAMLCDRGVTADQNVRWALASLIDRNSVVDFVLGGYGNTVDAEYGNGQWMYQEMAADLQQELLPISFNIDTANDYLDKTDWKFEADGQTPFDRTKAAADGSYLRHNAEGEKLEINHLGQANVFTDIIEIQYVANAPLAGIDFTVEKGEWSAVLDNYYNAFELEERVYETFNLATNFTAVFDRYYTWHSDLVGTTLNKAQLSDPVLDELIVKMRTTDPEDKQGYLDAWFEYQLRFNEIMPQIPLYSNEYYDISHAFVDNINTSSYAGYEDIICQITKTEK